MPKIIWVLASIVALGLLAGCATLSKQQCQAGDWRSIGVADGEAGLPLSQFVEHTQACGEHGITPDRSLYEGGRNEGLRLYCTIPNAEEVGLAGRTYYNVCEGEIGLSFSRVYRQAMDVHDVQQQLNSEEAELDRLLDRFTDETLTEDERVEIRRSIRDTQSSITLLELSRLREESELRDVIREESARMSAL